MEVKTVKRKTRVTTFRPIGDFTVPDGEVVTIHWRRFGRVFGDALWFAYDARQENAELNDMVRAKYVRMAIIMCALSLESAANCCLDALMLGDTPTKQLERRLGTFGKFDLYADVLGKPPVDRHNDLVRPVDELLELRNQYVHPKVTRVGHAAKRGCTVEEIEIEEAAHLRIPTNPDYWHPIHARRTIEVVCDFLNYFLLGHCGLQPPQSQAVLLSEIRRGQRKRIRVLELESLPMEVLAIPSMWKLDDRFLWIWKEKTHLDNEGREVSTFPAYPDNITQRVCWLGSDGIRHNSTCKSFRRNDAKRCGEQDGRVCTVCGG